MGISYSLELLRDARRVREIQRAQVVIDREELPRKLEAFVRAAWPVLEPARALQWNWHHTIICEYLEAVESAEIRRLIINVPPRCMKSLLVSVFYPAWVWTREPAIQFLTLSHSDALAMRDAVKSRTLMQSEWYQARWGKAWRFTPGQSEKSYYSNTMNGHRNAQGISGGITGKGGDRIIMDDPHDQERAQSDVERANATTAYDTKISSRKNDPAESRELLIMQRLHQVDMSGHLAKKVLAGWVSLVLPMEYDGPRYIPIRPALADPRTNVRVEDDDGNLVEHGELLDPARYPADEVATLSEDLGSYAAAGQLQQRPTPKGGGILRERWWRRWPKTKPLPLALKIIQSYDTAFSDAEERRVRSGQSPSYSARTTWGVFWDDERARHCLMLLESWRAQCSYPDLRREVIDEANIREPDYLLIESKASGQGLIPDLRRAGLRSGITIHGYNPGADGDKMTRAALVSAQLESGQIWAPTGKSWAETVIGECSTFPNGGHDDLVDTCTQAWLFAKRLHIVAHPDDEDGRPLYSRNRTDTQRIQAAYA